jgi:ribosomal protein S18 acetylase RimI-like enzyme
VGAAPVIVRGIPDGLLQEAAELLREAFAEKVAHELRPRDDAQAVRVIAACIEPSRALVALDDRGVAGLAAIEYRGAPFLLLRFDILVREFGCPGALWRKAYSLIDLVAAPRSKHTARLEVLAVRSDLRGCGLGGVLIAAAIGRAASEGMREITLEVVDTNGRARALYERHGFTMIRTLHSGPVTAGAGYRAVHFMRRSLP